MSIWFKGPILFGAFFFLTLAWGCIESLRELTAKNAKNRKNRYVIECVAYSLRF